jgi:hypothetical protein
MEDMRWGCWCLLTSFKATYVTTFQGSQGKIKMAGFEEVFGLTCVWFGVTYFRSDRWWCRSRFNSFQSMRRDSSRSRQGMWADDWGRKAWCKSFMGSWCFLMIFMIFMIFYESRLMRDFLSWKIFVFGGIFHFERWAASSETWEKVGFGLEKWKIHRVFDVLDFEMGI